MTRRAFAVLALGLATLATHAQADEVRTRIAIWNGTTFVPLCSDTLYATAGGTYRLRLQVGVFDTPGSPAAAGGMVGWRDGSVATTGGLNTRTPGCLAPFFSPLRRAIHVIAGRWRRPVPIRSAC